MTLVKHLLFGFGLLGVKAGNSSRDLATPNI